MWALRAHYYFKINNKISKNCYCNWAPEGPIAKQFSTNYRGLQAPIVLGKLPSNRALRALLLCLTLHYNYYRYGAHRAPYLSEFTTINWAWGPIVV